MKKIISAFLCLLLFTCLTLPSSATSISNNEINVIINGKTVEFSTDSGYPYIDENYRTMVPLRITMESCGAAVGYDINKETAIVITEFDRIEVPIGTNYFYNNNELITNDTVSVVTNGRTYLPIRAILESAGYTVEWNSDSRSVIAYNFSYDENDLVLYNTGSFETLIQNLLSGNVIYIDGKYYATPDYVKMLNTVQVNYLGDDLNTAIYPEEDHRYDLIDTDITLPEEPENDLDGIS
jgi:hypothetical protein